MGQGRGQRCRLQGVEALHHAVGAVRAQRRGMVAAVHTQHQAEAPGAGRRNARLGVLEDGGARGRHLQARGGREKGIRGRLAGEAVAGGIGAVDHGVEARSDAGRVEDAAAAATRRDHGARDAAGLEPIQQRQRRRVGLDAPLRKRLLEARILGISQSPQRVVTGRVVRRAFGQGDAARGQEVAHAVEARLAVDVCAVVGVGVEGAPVTVPGAARQEAVEQRLPCRGVHPRRAREHAVEVEDHQFEVRRRQRHRRGVTGRRAARRLLRRAMRHPVSVAARPRRGTLHQPSAAPPACP